jgi:hypothetical protein
MKKLLFAVVVLFTVTSATAQKVYTAQDVITNPNAIWFGIDFSKCKFIGNPQIGDRGYKSPQLVVKYSFGDWNSIPLAESGKYDIRGTFDKDYIVNDISAVTALNKEYNPDELIDFNGNHSIDKESIPDLVARYKNSLATEGIGIVYIVETYDHIKELATYYAVIFDIASKRVLFCEKVTGKPGGANLKTFWAGAFRDALDNTKSIYKKWKKGSK